MIQDKYRHVNLRLNEVAKVLHHATQFRNEVARPDVIQRSFEGVAVTGIENSLDFLVTAHHRQAYLKFSEVIIPDAYGGVLSGQYTMYLIANAPSEKIEYEADPVMTIRIDNEGDAHFDGDSVTCWPRAFDYGLTAAVACKWIISAIQRRITLPEAPK